MQLTNSPATEHSFVSHSGSQNKNTWLSKGTCIKNNWWRIITWGWISSWPFLILMDWLRRATSQIRQQDIYNNSLQTVYRPAILNLAILIQKCVTCFTAIAKTLEHPTDFHFNSKLLLTSNRSGLNLSVLFKVWQIDDFLVQTFIRFIWP